MSPDALSFGLLAIFGLDKLDDQGLDKIGSSGSQPWKETLQECYVTMDIVLGHGYKRLEVK